MQLAPSKLLEDWYKRSRLAQFAHYESAKLYERLHYLIGIPSMVLSIFVGTSIFAGLGNISDKKLQLFVGAISAIATILSGMQTFLNFSAKAEKHRTAASKYGALRRKIEENISSKISFSQENISSIRRSLDRLSEESPNIPSRIWNRRNEVLAEDIKHSVGFLKS
jgi:hypothetical protein